MLSVANKPIMLSAIKLYAVMLSVVPPDKHPSTGQNQGRVFNSRSGRVCATQLPCFETKRPNLELKTQPKQLLGSLPIDIPLTD
jgi:hypothetical protein